MGDNAIFNIKNDTMNSKQINFVRELEKAIHRSYQIDNDDTSRTLMNALTNVVKGKCAIIIPVDYTDGMPDDWVGLNEGDELTLENDIRLIPRTIESNPYKNGKKDEYMVVYTNEEEALKGPETNTYTVKVGNFLNTVLFKDGVDGIIINPFGDEPFLLDKDMIIAIFQCCIEEGASKSQKYYDRHKSENNVGGAIDLKDVLAYSSDVYKDQYILNTTTPLLIESMGTASMLSDMTGGPDLIIAGILGKAVNGGLVNLEDIKEKFGLRTAQILSSQTEDKTMPWYIRKLQYLNDISKDNDIEVKVLALTTAVSELRSIHREYVTDDTILLILDAPAKYLKWYYKELCKIFCSYAYEPLSEHIYAEMIDLYKKLFMNV